MVLVSQSGIALYDGDAQTVYQDGRAQLTPFRVLFFPANTTLPQQQVACLMLPLGKVLSVTRKAGLGSWSHPKLVLHMDGTAAPERAGEGGPSSLQSPTYHFTKLSFRTGGIDSFDEQLRLSLGRKLWTFKTLPSSSSASLTPANAASQPSPSSGFSTSNAGVGGLIKRNETEAQQYSRMLEAAVQDIDAVMRNANEIIQMMRGLTERSTAKPQEADEIRAVQQSLGLLSCPVTVEMVGSVAEFQAELARELEAWACHPQNLLFSKQQNPFRIIPLVELYAVYNRARGPMVGYLSPNDLLDACRRLVSRPPAKGGTVFRLVTFRSGLVALKLEDAESANQDVSSEPLVMNALRALMGPRPQSVLEWGRTGVPKTLVTDIALAQQLRVGTGVAKDILDELELDECLCRAENLGGVAYCWNVFSLYPTAQPYSLPA